MLNADTIEAALGAIRSGKRIDLVMIDVALDIGQFIACLVEERLVVPVAACGVAADARAAVAAIKAGAKEYIPLPPDADLIAAVLEAVTREQSALIHADPRTAALLAMAGRVAPSAANVLVVGESGTGKEVLARYLHTNSKRAQGPFVAVNCAAIPEQLLESELFGHEKGAFTGAAARRIGRFEEAHGGTLLLDEISEMDPRLQAKLLRAIQEREIARLGSSAAVKVDVRIVATSNRNLEEEVARGRFRGDLFFRLNVVMLRLPALRERPKDIPVLASHFVEKYAQLNGVPRPMLSAAALKALSGAPWPGNVRELENVLHRAVVLAQGGVIAPEDVAPQTGTATSAATLAGEAGAMVGRTVAAVERDLIVNTLKHCLGNRTHAATILGISIRTLRNKLRQYADEGVAIPRPTFGLAADGAFAAAWERR